MRHLAHAVFPFSDKRKYMLMLTAYIDETGHAQDAGQKFNGMAGLIAPAVPNWEAFERKWKATLAEYKIPYFHMREFEGSRFGSSKSMFYGWSDAKKEKLFAKLLRIMEVIYPLPVGALLPMDDFRTLSQDYQESFIDPYFFCFKDLLAACTTFLEFKRAHPDEKIAMVFSDQREYKRRALHIYDVLTDMPTLALARSASPPVFRDMREIVPLQAADIVAYEMYKEFERQRFRPNAEPRYGYKRLEKMSERVGFKPPMFRFFDKGWLADNAEKVLREERLVEYWHRKRATS